MREYIWQGGAEVEDDPETDENEFQAWCFAYGEEQWLEPGIIQEPGRPDRVAVFEDYRLDAEDNENLRVDCN